MSYDTTQGLSESVRANRRVVLMEEVVQESKKSAHFSAKGEMGPESDSKETPTAERLLMELPGISSVQYSFSANTFEELDKMVKGCLEDKELVTITCWHDGKQHHCMLGAKAVDEMGPGSVGEGKEVLVNGTPYRYRGQATVSKDGQMILQCY